MEALEVLPDEFDYSLSEPSLVPVSDAPEQLAPSTLERLMARRQEIIDNMAELTVRQFEQYRWSRRCSAELTVEASTLSGELNSINDEILSFNRGPNAV